MKKTMIAASIALAVTLTACGKNDAPGNAATSNEVAFDSAVDANAVDETGNVTIAEDGSIANDSDNAVAPIGNAE
jgi:outer membrane lipoprotein SlyB